MSRMHAVSEIHDKIAGRQASQSIVSYPDDSKKQPLTPSTVEAALDFAVPVSVAVSQSAVDTASPSQSLAATLDNAPSGNIPNLRLSFSSALPAETRLPVVLLLEDLSELTVMVEIQGTVRDIMHAIGSRIGMYRANVERMTAIVEVSGGHEMYLDPDQRWFDLRSRWLAGNHQIPILADGEKDCWTERTYDKKQLAQVRKDNPTVESPPSTLLIFRQFLDRTPITLGPNDEPDFGALDVMYFHCVSRILSSCYSGSDADPFQLAAFQMQVELGDNNPSLHKVGFFTSRQRLMDFLPKTVVLGWETDEAKRNAVGSTSYFDKLQERVLYEHSIIRGTSSDIAKQRYVDLLRDSPLFGADLFRVKDVESAVWRYISITSANVSILTYPDKVPLVSMPLDKVHSIVPNNKAIGWRLEDGNIYCFVSPESFFIAKLLKYVIKRLEDEKKQEQEPEEVMLEPFVDSTRDGATDNAVTPAQLRRRELSRLGLGDNLDRDWLRDAELYRIKEGEAVLWADDRDERAFNFYALHGNNYNPSSNDSSKSPRGHKHNANSNISHSKRDSINNNRFLARAGLEQKDLSNVSDDLSDDSLNDDNGENKNQCPTCRDGNSYGPSVWTSQEDELLGEVLKSRRRRIRKGLASERRVAVPDKRLQSPSYSRQDVEQAAAETMDRLMRNQKVQPQSMAAVYLGTVKAHEPINPNRVGKSLNGKSNPPRGEGWDASNSNHRSSPRRNDSRQRHAPTEERLNDSYGHSHSHSHNHGTKSKQYHLSDSILEHAGSPRPRQIFGKRPNLLSPLLLEDYVVRTSDSVTLCLPVFSGIGLPDYDVDFDYKQNEALDGSKTSPTTNAVETGDNTLPAATETEPNTEEPKAEEPDTEPKENANRISRLPDSELISDRNSAINNNKCCMCEGPSNKDDGSVECKCGCFDKMYHHRCFLDYQRLVGRASDTVCKTCNMPFK